MRIPSMIGFTNVISVHIAAIPIAPAPISRTFCAHTAEANALALCPAAGDITDVRYGTNTPHAKIVPTNIAIPLAIPIK